MNPEWKALEGRADVVERMREERHKRTLRLEDLIRVFQRADCSEMRDKIYGFLGLAHDGSDQAITVDYSISFAQLYAQVLEFQQKRSTPSDALSAKDLRYSSTRLIQFSQLLQRVLGGSVAEKVGTMKDPNWSKSFYETTGSVSGEILRLGPTHAELVSSVRANRSWKQAIAQTYLVAEDLQYVRKANDAITDAMLGWDQRQLERLQGIRSATSYAYRRGGTDADIPPILASEEENGTLDASEPILFLGSQNLIGVGPPEMKIGDVVCTFSACDIVVIVRKIEHEAKARYLIVGRAEVYREKHLDVYGEEEVEDVVGYDLSRLAVDDEDGLPDDGSLQGEIDFRLDLQTLQQLTS
ncbi:uncharacterized protein DNG_04449 [Cephalotrichum gorgonifer]|uniref:Uncharacterized protein n=1 Tax=Cephalotrichum gorgonifer TaxID=2041049 RepID=A0AAE8MW52_9PEZI|nr:uncharacterized protein DNG_04449 [Cephalotrichum gorgonifer]